MSARSLFGLLAQSLRRSRRSFGLSVFGIAVGISSLAFFLALSLGVGRVLGRVFPAGQVEVVPPSNELDSGPLGVLSSLGRPPALSREIAEQLRARPEVKAVYPRMRLAFPARASGGAKLLGRDVRGELIAEGLDPAAVDGPTAPIAFTDDPGSQKACASDAECSPPEYCAFATVEGGAGQCERPVPAVISPFILELYNGTIAPSHGLPRISNFLAGRLRGFTFTAELGQSFFALPSSGKSGAPPRNRRVMLVGISPRAARLALTLPLATVQRWNREQAGEPAGRELSSVLVELKEGADVARFAQAVRALGFQLADSGAERVGLLLTLLTLLFALVSFAIVALAGVNLAHSFYRAVAERKRELGILRAVGASAADVQRLMLAEAAAIGLGGGALGLGVAWLSALALDAAAARFLPDFPFKPDSYFAFDWRIIAGALLCAVIACMAGAFLPARAAAKLDPAEALSTP